MFINFSNHPSKDWQNNQIEAASVYGQIKDIPFPIVNPIADEKEIICLANSYVKKIIDMLATVQKPELSAVHIMGELSLCFSVIKRLQQLNIKCICSTTNRIVSTDNSNKKITQFYFQKFRTYEHYK